MSYSPEHLAGAVRVAAGMLKGNASDDLQAELAAAAEALSALSETRAPTFENLQDAPRTLRNVFTVQHEGKRADVVFASFASCIEREANALRHDMERGMANHNADLNAAPSATRAPTCEMCNGRLEIHCPLCDQDDPEL